MAGKAHLHYWPSPLSVPFSFPALLGPRVNWCVRALRLRDLGDHCAGARPDGENIVRLLPSRRAALERRITSKLVIFRKPFALSGLGGILPPGSYTVRTEEEMLDAVSFIGWHQTSTTLVLHRAGEAEYVTVNAQELREALVRDGDQGTDPPAAPSQAATSGRRVRDQLRRGARQ